MIYLKSERRSIPPTGKGYYDEIESKSIENKTERRENAKVRIKTCVT